MSLVQKSAGSATSHVESVNNDTDEELNEKQHLLLPTGRDDEGRQGNNSVVNHLLDELIYCSPDHDPTNID